MKIKRYRFICVLQNVTFVRLYNFLLLNISFLFSLILKKPFIKGVPHSIAIETSNFCNLSCPECPKGIGNLNRNSGCIETNLFEKIINETYKQLLFVSLYFQGEPFLNHNIYELISILKKKKIYTSISTNGTFFKDHDYDNIINSGLDEIIISIDGPDAATYNKYRVGGDFSKVTESIRKLSEIKKKRKVNHPLIIAQCIVFSFNEYKLSEIEALVLSLGADVFDIKSAQIYNLEQTNLLIPTQHKYSRYKLENGIYKIKSKSKNHCYKMWNSCVFTWDGNVVPCCYDKDACYVMGDITEKPFLKIWKGSSYYNFRKKILKQKNTIEMCNNCVE